MSKLIKAFVRVPDGPLCQYPNEKPCDHMEWCPATKVHYCGVFHDKELMKVPGSENYMKCDGCFKACRDAVREAGPYGY